MDRLSSPAIIRKSDIGLAIISDSGRGDKCFIAGFPRALSTDRFWSTGGEFETYILDNQIGIAEGIEMLSSETAFYAKAPDVKCLHNFIDELESHFKSE